MQKLCASGLHIELGLHQAIIQHNFIDFHYAMLSSKNWIPMTIIELKPTLSSYSYNEIFEKMNWNMSFLYLYDI